jgi:hypothetical protein
LILVRKAYQLNRSDTIVEDQRYICRADDWKANV